jgi:hypothetical protein
MWPGPSIFSASIYFPGLGKTAGTQRATASRNYVLPMPANVHCRGAAFVSPVASRRWSQGLYHQDTNVSAFRKISEPHDSPVDHHAS